MATNLSEMANEMADILADNVEGVVLRYEDLDAEDVAEFSVELEDGRRCMVSVLLHPED